MTYYTNIERFKGGIVGSVHDGIPSQAKGQIGTFDLDDIGNSDYVNGTYLVPLVGGSGAGAVVEVQIGDADPADDNKVVNTAILSGDQGMGYKTGDKAYLPGRLMGGTGLVNITIDTVFGG